MSPLLSECLTSVDAGQQGVPELVGTTPLFLGREVIACICTLVVHHGIVL